MGLASCGAAYFKSIVLFSCVSSRGGFSISFVNVVPGVLPLIDVILSAVAGVTAAVVAMRLVLEIRSLVNLVCIFNAIPSTRLVC